MEYITSLSNQKITVEIDPALVRPVDTPVICCDYSKVKRELGWEPKLTVFNALQDLYKSYL